MSKPLIIGIAGGSASGKSTISTRIKERFTQYNIHIIGMDSYFKPADELPTMKSPISGEILEDHNHPTTIYFDKCKEDIFIAAKDESYDLVVVDGLFALLDEDIRKLYDLKLFVDVPSDERMYRRIKRNMQYGQSMEDIAEFYLGGVRYRHDEFVEPTRWQADLVINGKKVSPHVYLLVEKLLENSKG